MFCTDIPCPVHDFRGMVTACLAKRYCADFLWEKYCYMNDETHDLLPPPPYPQCFHQCNCLKHILVQCLGSGWSRDNVVGIATTLWNGRNRVWIPVGTRNFVFSRNVQTDSRATQSLVQWTPWFFTVCKATIHFHLMPRLRISGTIPLLPHVCFYSMDRGSFTFR